MTLLKFWSVREGPGFWRSTWEWCYFAKGWVLLSHGLALDSQSQWSKDECEKCWSLEGLDQQKWDFQSPGPWNAVRMLVPSNLKVIKLWFDSTNGDNWEAVKGGNRPCFQQNRPELESHFLLLCDLESIALPALVSVVGRSVAPNVCPPRTSVCDPKWAHSVKMRSRWMKVSHSLSGLCLIKKKGRDLDREPQTDTQGKRKSWNDNG